ncbi:unknown [Roseburia sp. CAG:303]|nr:unknown [Roseburia sp. CAG:303]
MNRQNIWNFIKAFLLIFLFAILCVGFLRNEINHVVEKNENSRILPMETIQSKPKEQFVSSVSPWNEYKKENVTDLSPEQKEFLTEQDAAGEILSMANYSETILEDTESQRTFLYDNLQVLHADNKDYYVLYQVQLAEKYFYALFDTDGTMFSFQMVSDYRYIDNGESLTKVMEHYHYSENDTKYDLDNINDVFIMNRELFIDKLGNFFVDKNFTSYASLLQRIDWNIYPNNLLEENGCIIFNYYNEDYINHNIYLYIDKKTTSFCGYHIF